MSLPFPEALYLRRPADQGVSLLKTFIRTLQVTEGDTSIDIAIPNDTALFLIVNNACLEALPGVDQFSTEDRLLLRDPFNTEHRIALIFPGTAAGLSTALNFSGTILIPPRWTLLARANFSFIAANNSAIFTVNGCFIPRGTLENP